MAEYLLADRHACSVGRAIDALGDTWSLLVLLVTPVIFYRLRERELRSAERSEPSTLEPSPSTGH